MEGEICLYDKFGHCKYGKECKRKHYETECKDLDNCKSMKSCMKRHPKYCKKFASGECRFKSDCSYKHKEPTSNIEQDQLKEKVKQLEKVLQAMTRKVLNLEEEIVKIKKDGVGGAGKVKERVSEVMKGKSEDKGFKPKRSSTPKDKDVVKKATQTEHEKDVLSCSKCEYVTKKEVFLKKHNNTKHQDHICKECKEKFQTFMELLKHVADQHSEEEVEEADIEGNEDKIHVKMHMENKEIRKNTVFVFGESL